MRLLQWTLWSVGLALQYLVLAALLRGPFRQFKLIFIYVFLLLTTTIADIAALYTITRSSPLYAKYYWAAEIVRQSGLFAVVVSLVIDLIPDSGRKRSILYFLLACACLFWLGSIVLLYNPVLNTWMTKVVRNLSFGSAVLNLGLWFTLISTGSRDTRRLLITGGLGLQMTGEAIGQSLRHIFPQYNTALVGSLLVVFAHFLCLLVWWQAFTRETPDDVSAHAPLIRSGTRF